MPEFPQPSDRRALLQNALQAIDELQTKLDALERTKNEPIAIIGLSCRFPGGANSPEAFWQLLQEGRDVIQEVPSERFPTYASNRARSNDGERWYGGFLDGLDQFEPGFFGISPREANTMDPQQRLVLEVTWEALERAGILPEGLIDSQTGVFIGITTSDYGNLAVSVGSETMDVYTATGSALNVSAGRVAYILGLHGPTLAVDTACSSSMTAIHLACQSLRTRESNLALAGGVNVILSPEPYIIFSRWGMMAPDGRCKTFDASADGFVRSEGCGILVLKRLSEAQADGDPILALIRGSAVNEDGKSSGLTVPNGLAQQAVIRSALAAAGLKPSQISYVETHGTGTSLGDPIEVEAIGAALGEGRTTPLTIGSVKTNIGHCESASGVAGIIKTVLAMQHNEFPPHLHLKERSPQIPWPNFPIHIPTERTPWPRGDEPRRAGVSSFGFSGVNAHVIIEEAPSVLHKEERVRVRPVELIPFSAKSEAALQDYAHKLAEHFADHPDLSLMDAAHTLAVARTRYPNRLAITAATPGEVAEKLSSAAILPASHESPKVAFLFTGQGAQYVGMGRQLYETQPVFRAVLDHCDEILRPLLAVSLLNILYPQSASGDQQAEIDNTVFTQPALFALEYALTELWKSWGIQPQAAMGHSVGEYVAACAAGVFSLEDGLKLIAGRGRLMGALPSGGEMAAVFAPLDRVKVAIADSPVSIGAINGPENIVISGDGAAVQEILTSLSAEGVKARRLIVSHAFHSVLMEPILDDFEGLASSIQMVAPKISLVSNVTARPAGMEITRPGYWRQHIRQPVRFTESIAALRELGCNTFVEIGPNPTLLSMAQRCLPDANEQHWLPSLRKGKSDWEAMLTSLSELYTHGAEIDWQGYEAPYPPAQRIALPTYPFQRQRYWVEAHPQRPTYQRPIGSHPLLGPRLDVAHLSGLHIWQDELNLDRLRYLGDHRVQGLPILPFTAYIEMANAAVVEAYGPGPVCISGMEARKMLLIPEGAAPLVQVVLTQQAENILQLQIYSRPTRSQGDYDPQEPWILHAQGKIQRLIGDQHPHILERFDLAAIQARCTEEITGEAFYHQLSEKGNQWGPTFQGVERLWRGQDEALSHVRVLPSLAADVPSYQLHPAIADSTGHVLAATIPLEKSSGSKGGAFVGGGLDQTFIYQSLRGQSVWAYARLRPSEAGQENVLIGDIAVYDEAGQLISETIRARFWYLDVTEQRRLVENVENWLYTMQWEEIPASPKPSIPSDPASWLLFADSSGVVEALADHLRASGQRVIRVDAGESFTQSSDDSFTVNPLQPEDYHHLLDIALTRGSPPLRRIAHLWSLDTPKLDALTAVELLQAQERILGSALYLVQALNAANLPIPPHLWLVTQNAVTTDGTSIQAAQSALWGMGRSLAAEHSEFWGGLVDLDTAASPAQNAASLQNLLLATDREDQTALRGEKRYGLRLTRHILSARRTLKVTSEGAYWITGGLGGLGLQVAGWLVQQGARRIVLFSRSKLPPREEWDTLPTGHRQAAQVQAIRALETQGAIVWPASVDVAEEDALSAFWQEYQTQNWPAVRGLVHAAGTMQYQSLRDHSLAEMHALLRPKVAGVWLLHQLLKNQPLDFFVLFSSASAILSSPLMSSYAAANTFLDAFAFYRRSLGLPALSINWGTWGEAGMAVSFADTTKEKPITVAGTMTNQQGLQALEVLLRQDAPQIAVMPLDWETWQKQYPAFTKAPFLSIVLQPVTETVPATRPRLERTAWLAATEAERLPMLQSYLVQQSAGIMGFAADNLDPTQSISNLGLDSLMAVELKNRIEADLAVVIPMVQLLEGPSVNQLAQDVFEKLSATSAGPESASERTSKWEEGEL